MELSQSNERRNISYQDSVRLLVYYKRIEIFVQIRRRKCNTMERTEMYTLIRNLTKYGSFGDANLFICCWISLSSAPKSKETVKIEQLIT